MEIDLTGSTIELKGASNPVAEAALAALRANGGRVLEEARPAGVLSPDIVLVSCPLRPGSTAENPGTLYAAARKAAVAMTERGGGRIVFLLSVTAGMPMRRHPRFSMENASILAGMRTLAMEFGPKILVNAVGVGLVEDETMVSGDKAMLSHVPVNRPGNIEEAVAAVLFFCDPLNTYTTGQMLGVDGGWMAGYGRNF
ncbi:MULTISPECIES: SDR family oxidoreductase [unclassified Mesorhizobium]|uniref:SDR family NAD(P)-dependent oxidoreductase n=1 Tax=unclassified Mesorhizobium TaxID=325217 RepID=UPI000FEA1FE1|nr:MULTISPECIES: SDR family oxidoreductase [unclassified Mesorhizobium]RWF42635.1 MAG: SDR family oxidoreductase [Mesorhizobium sp.]TGT82789.1 SDR family oxidoreductase [Mesorhizobium sp. M8A.F.Ca.ET.161.01.1.1]TGV36391.1 SDR family oxidoreductase [Mesorhizobium sp. M8A.F.Ca.ET.142.01.1.1]TIT30728.1 MAG: SDR family oxidoreductase [Mesorhizobium sp.]